MKWDFQLCQLCSAPKKTLHGFKDDPARIKMCKSCYNKELKKRQALRKEQDHVN